MRQGLFQKQKGAQECSAGERCMRASTKKSRTKAVHLQDC